MAPLLFTTGNRLHRPVDIDRHTHASMHQATTSNHESVLKVKVCLLPQIELILAVGRKLSTKSDIKLPRSFTETV